MSDEIFSSLERYIAHPRISSLALSPDGSRLVTCVQTLNTTKDGYTTSLWEVDPSGTKGAHRLTRSVKGESAPAFTAGGDLYFISARSDEKGGDEGSALWRLPARGGEAEMLNRRPSGVSAVHTAAAAETVAITAPLLPGAADERDHRALHSTRKDASVNAVLHTGYPVRYWDHDLGPARPHLFVLEEAEQGQTAEGPEAESAQKEDSADTPEPHQLRSITPGIGARFSAETHLSADGTHALISIIIPEARADQRGGIALVDTGTGERRIIADDPELSFSPGPISPCGTKAAVVATPRPTPRHAVAPALYTLDLAEGHLTRMAEGVDLWLSPASARPWIDQNHFLATADKNGRGAVFMVEASTGEATEIPVEDGVYSEVLPSPAGDVAYALRSSYAYPLEVVRIDLTTGAVTRLPNPAQRPTLPGPLTEMQTTTDDGVTIRSWLALPENASAHQAAPLLLWIHGGPLSSWNQWSWRWNPWLAVQQGYAVLLPDPALSTGYGQDFVQRGWNSWGDAPYTDLMAITDAAEAREDIDASRTAAMGGSFGGYMANWVAASTDRFDAIVTHASLWALDQFGSTTDMSPFWRRQIDRTMAEHHSPHHKVESITTPMLVIHGDKDYRVPIGEGLRLWYELLADSGLPADAEGETPHRFLYFPQENHWILTPQHAKVWYQVVFAFLAEHVLGEPQQLPAELGLSAPERTKDDDGGDGI